MRCPSQRGEERGRIRSPQSAQDQYSSIKWHSILEFYLKSQMDDGRFADAYEYVMHSKRTRDTAIVLWIDFVP